MTLPLLERADCNNRYTWKKNKHRKPNFSQLVTPIENTSFSLVVSFFGFCVACFPRQRSVQWNESTMLHCSRLSCKNTPCYCRQNCSLWQNSLNSKGPLIDSLGAFKSQLAVLTRSGVVIWPYEYLKAFAHQVPIFSPRLSRLNINPTSHLSVMKVFRAGLIFWFSNEG